MFILQFPSHYLIKCDANISLENKKDILRKNGRCFRCTRCSHNAKNCRVNVKCISCNGRHATVMCDPEYLAKINKKGGQTVSMFTGSTIESVLLQTACAFVANNDTFSKEEMIRMILDGGSQLSFIKEETSKRLKLRKIGTHKISIIPFGSTQRAPAKLCNRVEINLKCQYSDNIVKITAAEVPEICLETLKVPKVNNPGFSKFKLADIVLRNGKDEKISLLVGADNYWKIVTGQTEKLTERLTAVNTKFGWTIHGPIESSDICTNLINVLHSTVSEENLDLTAFWDLEAIGINEKDEHQFSVNFENNIELKDGRYEVRLPWKIE